MAGTSAEPWETTAFTGNGLDRALLTGTEIFRLL